MTTAEGCSRLMARAFELARAVRGTTSPNPAVGAVVAQGEQIVGEGATQPPGGPHAEAVALREAGSRARGAALYVTLEPCAHFGRTPPCTAAILGTGIARVVVAVGDPDSRVAGRGLDQLREAGVTVELGDGAALGAAHYEAYAHHRRSGRPFVTAKFAASLDGRIAATSGDSRWISGPETLRWAHQNRPLFDAMLVGVETIIVDNPQLTARPERWRGPIPQPLRVVLDSRGRTPPNSRVLEGVASSPTLIAATDAAPSPWRAAVQARGAELALLPAGADGRVSLPALLDLLGGERGVVSLLVEGGGEVLGSFFDQRLIDKVTAVVAPMIIGGAAQTAVRGRGAERMRDALRLNRLRVEQLGADLLLSGYPSHPERELELRIRPAGRADADMIDQLLAIQGVEGAPSGTALLNAARRGRVVVWLAAVPTAQSGRRQSGGAQDILGVAAVDCRATPAAVLCLAVRSDAPASAAERLRTAGEASAAGRGAAWLTLPLDAAPGLTEAQYRAAGYRYYRRGAGGSAVLIKRLTP